MGGPTAVPQAMPPTSQGWLDFDTTRGGLVWTDANRIAVLDLAPDPVTPGAPEDLELVCAMQRDGGWVGQAVVGNAIQGVYQGAAFQALPNASGGSLPHLASDGAGNFCIAAPLEGGQIAVVL